MHFHYRFGITGRISASVRQPADVQGDQFTVIGRALVTERIEVVSTFSDKSFGSSQRDGFMDGTVADIASSFQICARASNKRPVPILDPTPKAPKAGGI